MNEKPPLKQVLLVEDSLLSQRITIGTLKDTCKVTCAETTQAAQNALSTSSFDLIITDMMLKEETAMGFIKHVRNQFGPKELPIVVLTSSLDDGILNKFILAGVNDAFQKPVLPKVLLEVVNRLLTTPYIRERVKGSPVPVQYIFWEAHGRFFAFNPDTAQITTGSTKTEAADKLSALVRSLLEVGPELDLVIEMQSGELYLNLD